MFSPLLRSKIRPARSLVLWAASLSLTLNSCSILPDAPAPAPPKASATTNIELPEVIVTPMPTTPGYDPVSISPGGGSGGDGGGTPTSGGGGSGGGSGSGSGTGAKVAALEAKYRERMSAAERLIYDSMSLLQKFQYLTNGEQAETYTEQTYSGASLEGGNGDAYRHAYFSGMNAHDLGNALTKRLSDAHEDNPKNNPLSKDMDIKNSDAGLQINSLLSSSRSDSDLRNAVTLWLDNGYLTIIENNKQVPSHP